MGNRIAVGAIIVILMAGGVYFANLSKESDRAFRVSNEVAISRGNSLDQERKERKRLEDVLKRQGADLQKGRKALAQLREASAIDEGNILNLREKVADLDATAERNRSALRQEREAAVRLREAAGRYEAELKEFRKKAADDAAALRREGEAKKILEKKLKAREMALVERRKRAVQLTKSLSGFEADILRLQKAVAGKSAAAEQVGLRLMATKTSLSEMGERHRSAKARAREESQRAAKLRASLDALKKQISGKELSLKKTKDMLRIDIVNRLLFDVGSAEVREKGRDALDKLVDFFKIQSDKIIRIEGHTDNQPISGALARRYPTNWELSSARAIAVVRYLQSKGVPPERLSAAGYSFYQEEASNETKKGRARNRRIVILMSRLKPSR